MKWQLKLGAVIVVIALMGSAAFSVWSVYTENGRLTEKNQALNQSLSAQIALNHQQQARMKHLAEQDAVRLQELTHAKSEIDKLHSAALAHPERVYIKARCPAPAPGLADAVAPRPVDTAVGNYWLLRERIALAGQMIRGLQDYIQTQCQLPVPYE
ncbi:lysis system i-spanin subunit Rz [Xenorhabdus eapokensis]|uniref:Lysis protein n=1 Tax=Xenorhabdus eapokensis TaxID=1873482 RepID=A0A1Q5TUL4_9GAMM|nr:lysis system i-spanin subunit Rz [Xenorhabdus eapokensis]OKP03925.1 lysis protein [Xenorhabdus eapokensis]